MRETLTETTWRRRAVAAAGAAALLLTAVPADATAEPATAAAPDGQLVLELEPTRGGAVETAEFVSPNGHATVRLHLDGRSAGQLRVNGETVPGASAAFARGGTHVLDVSEHTERGTNELEVRLVRAAATVTVDHPTVVDSDPAAVGADPEGLAAIDEVVASRSGTDGDALYTGATVLVAHRGHLIHHSAHGDAQAFDLADGEVVPLDDARPTTIDTIFDVASITKVAATTAAVMELVDRGELDLDDRLGDLLPRFDGEKADITVQQLLTHRSGLWEWQPTWLHGQGKDEVLDFLADLELRYPIGDARRYSDIGFMLLGAIVEEVTGTPFDDHVAATVYAPLGMDVTGFTPDASLRDRIAATSHGNPFEYSMIETGSPYPVDGDPADFDGWRNYTLVGEVNDGNAWYGWQGVAGHAGLFSTARDLAIFGQTLINGGGYGDHTLVSPQTVDTFLATPFDANQAHGFWPNRLSGAVGVPGGYGHGGFTGTEFLFDPDRELVVVLLTNRQHLGLPYSSIWPVWSQVLKHAVAATDGS
jgi:serine-type D-Ala-D-Ala carboxypeptidase